MPDSASPQCSIWSYADPGQRGYGLFKLNFFRELKKRGWQTHLAEVPLLEPGAQAQLREDFLSQDRPWVLLINQTAAQLADYLGLPREKALAGRRFLVWFLDDPRFFLDGPLTQQEIALCFDETYLDILAAHQPRHVLFWPLAADCQQPGQLDERFRCEVCFVGGVVDQRQRRSQLQPAMREYVDHLVELKLTHREKTFDELALQHPIAPGKQIRITPQVAHYLYWEANNRYRLSVVEAMQDFDLRIYGNEGWLSLLEGSPLLERFHGPIDPNHELPHCFATAPINLNIHSIQCMGSLNQRDFNAPVAGGFLLSDWAPAAGRYFNPGQEAVYWSQIDDLRAKAAYFLRHPEERQALVERGRKRVEQSHTYAQRIDSLLAHLAEWGETG